MAQEAGKEREQGKQGSGMEHQTQTQTQTHQGQATGVTADAEKAADAAFEPQKPQKSSTSESKKGPEGGYDDTPIPRREVHAPALSMHRARERLALVESSR